MQENTSLPLYHTTSYPGPLRGSEPELLNRAKALGARLYTISLITIISHSCCEHPKGTPSNLPAGDWFWLSLKTLKIRKSGLGLPVRAVTLRDCGLG